MTVADAFTPTSEDRGGRAVHKEPKSLTECFDEGVDARAAKKAMNTNLYAAGTAERREWSAGWSATCDLDEEDDPFSSRIVVDEDTDEDTPE